MELKTALGKGTSITIRLPVTLAIIQALLARVEDETYALPLTHVRETLQLTPSVVRRVRGNDVLVLRDQVLPLLSLRQIVNLPVRDASGEPSRRIGGGGPAGGPRRGPAARATGDRGKTDRQCSRSGVVFQWRDDPRRWHTGADP